MTVIIVDDFVMELWQILKSLFRKKQQRSVLFLGPCFKNKKNSWLVVVKSLNDFYNSK